MEKRFFSYYIDLSGIEGEGGGICWGGVNGWGGLKGWYDWLLETGSCWLLSGIEVFILTEVFLITGSMLFAINNTFDPAKF